MNTEESIQLVKYVKRLADLDPTNCKLGPPVQLSASNPSLTIDLKNPSPNTWSIVQKAIELNAESRGWSYTSGPVRGPVPGFTASVWIPATIHSSSVASIYPEGFCLLQAYVTLLEVVK